MSSSVVAQGESTVSSSVMAQGESTVSSSVMAQGESTVSSSVVAQRHEQGPTRVMGMIACSVLVQRLLFS